MEIEVLEIPPQVKEEPVEPPPSPPEASWKKIVWPPPLRNKINWDKVSDWFVLLLTPFLLLLRYLIKSYIRLQIKLYRDRKKVDLAHKCPACGHCVVHEIEFSELYGKILHTCAVCKAEFSSDPIRKWDTWRVYPRELREEETPLIPTPPTDTGVSSGA